MAQKSDQCGPLRTRTLKRPKEEMCVGVPTTQPCPPAGPLSSISGAPWRQGLSMQTPDPSARPEAPQRATSALHISHIIRN